MHNYISNRDIDMSTFLMCHDFRLDQSINPVWRAVPWTGREYVKQYSDFGAGQFWRLAV